MPTAEEALGAAPAYVPPAASRWDDELPADEPSSAAAQARAEFERRRVALDEREASDYGLSAHRQSQGRERRAGDYYDAHRAELASSGPESAIARHLATREMAKTIGQYASPRAAADAHPDDRREAARQHVLWKHSLWLDDEPVALSDGLAQHFKPRPFTEDDATALDAGLRKFGSVTRGPRMAKVNMADRAQELGPAGATSIPGGHILLASNDSGDITDHVARSLAMRHLRPDFDRFNAGMRERTAGKYDPVEEMSDHGYRMGAHDRISRDGLRGDHIEDFAGGLARSVLHDHAPSHPVLHANLAPTAESIRDLEAISGHRAEVHSTWHR